MKEQNIFWAANVKLLRNRKKLSQEELAERLSISRPKLNAHENGRTVNPPLEDLIKFSTFFSLGIDTLVKVNLAKLSELKIRELEAGNDAFATGTSIRVLATTVDRNNNENAEFVPVAAKAGYAGGYADPDYIAKLPKFSMPYLPQNRTYRMFPTTGLSMLPIPEGSLVVCEYIHDWLQLRSDTLCIVILKNNGSDFVFKQVENRILQDRTLLLKSLNPEFKPYAVSVADVLEIWKFVSYVSDTVPVGDVSLSVIAQAIQEIKVDIAKIANISLV